MPNPICEKCVPNKPEAHADLVQSSGCNSEYEAVNVCMKGPGNGNISSCKDQWDKFRKCFELSKAAADLATRRPSK